MEKGSRELSEVARALDGIRLGISCLTPENLKSPRLLFEAGALSKSIDYKTRLCTYLYGALDFQDVKAPLSTFQATKADREDTRKLIHSINRALQEVPIPEADLDELFDAMWPNLEKSLARIPGPNKNVDVKRSTEDMVTKILAWARAESQRRPVPGPTLDLNLVVAGHPVSLDIAGLPEMLEPMVRPALVEFLTAEIQTAIHRTRATLTSCEEPEQLDVSEPSNQ